MACVDQPPQYSLSHKTQPFAHATAAGHEPAPQSEARRPLAGYIEGTLQSEPGSSEDALVEQTSN
jgi:hypothetical protein